MENFDDLVDGIIDTVNKKPVTYVALILDESGSMQPLKTEIIGGFNAQIKSLTEKEEDMVVKLSFVKFNSEVKVLFWNKKPSDAKLLDDGNYVPAGMTALCDAVGRVILEFKKIAKKNPEASFLVTILSDGAENSSQNYKASDIKEMIQELTATNMWTFTYMGANQDMWDVAKTYGIDLGNTVAFMASSEGVRNVNAYSMNSTDAYFNARRQGVTSVSSFYQTTDEEKKAHLQKPPVSL